MKNLDWDSIYTAILYIIKNYPLTIITYCSGCLVAGLFISVLLTLFMRKYKAFSRKQKYYNWLVKLYIPAIFMINIIFSLKVGLFWGSYEALKKDSYAISSQVYHSSMGSVFTDPRERIEFIEGVRSVVSEVNRNNKNMKIRIGDIVQAYNTKYKLLDQPKNRIASWLAAQYGDQINSMVLYGILNAVPNTKMTGDLSYHEFDTIMKKLLVLNPQDIENSIVEKIQNLFLMVLKTQFKTIAEGLVIIWIILMIIPWVEFWIYTAVMKKIIKKNIIE